MFNLSKHADFAEMVGDASEALQQGFDEPEAVTRSEEDIIGDLGPETDERERVLDLRKDEQLMRVLEDLARQYPAEIEAINSVLTSQSRFAQLRNELSALPGLTEQYGMEALAPQVGSFDEYKLDETRVLNAVRRLNRNRIEFERNQLPLAAFNLQRHKQAQIQTTRFPVSNEGDFVAKFADDLLSFNNRPGTPEYEKARLAAEEIRNAVSPGFEEEANSVLEAVMQLDPSDRHTAAKHLIKVYEVLLPPDHVADESMMGDQAQMMEPVMSQKNQDGVEGIVRYSLTEQVLNNKQASNEGGMVKTAADQFGQHYLLYGPTEKRICPKLRGKNLSVGDVVSEYTCRHHCIDGIVIDDNKTICGEALWRANAMDKYSREYVDEDGDIVGGYINKRFEINRNVPEENKMRLKPGETRKPRPAAWGNMESRLQDMRAKEGQSRDYRPQTNTGDPFEWCHNPDQNNVEVSQAERDRREGSSGHQLVEYTNRNEGENNPKVTQGFNMTMHKTASTIPVDHSAFNLKQHKEAKSPPGFKHTVEHMKAEHGDEVDNPFALAWWMKNKGYKSHKGPGDVHKCDDDDKKMKSSDSKKKT